MKKANSYCGLLFGVGIFLLIIGIINVVAFNINEFFEGFNKIMLYFVFSVGSLLLFLSFVISKILDNIEGEMTQLRDRVLELDIKVNEQKRKY
ncbi:hypothetical protein H1D32_10715 [Anaerobacillus sp. CMMVII]|uniref:hypothetical protein n=1 Tax=Anaerobacillus sp. CMMVII TaxID=2755588 RepID=UPI0021B750C5|nr:hypothetical protein [Anaerobacillus sp. CMMVII]MCT8138184.1 hypothetical protein [Anaerobacillus sp. CMMVII]